MTAYKDLSKEELLELKSGLEAQFEEVKAKGLKLDMSRGKPSADQLNLSMGMMDTLTSGVDLTCEDGVDCRNYGGLDGIDEAKQLLADAGYPDGEGFPAITYKYPSLQLDSDMAQALQAQWKTNLGIEVELQAEEQQVQVAERRSGDFQLARMRWTADFTDPFTFLSMYRSNDSYNDNKTNCPEYDELMAQSNEESDPTARFELLHQAESVLVNDYCFGVPVLNSSNIYLVSTDITNFEIDPSRNMIRTKYLVLGDSSSES